MPNLVPLYVDKETGKLIAKHGSGASPSSSRAFGYFHEQTTDSISWNILHNQGTRRLICQIYTPDYHIIFPDDIIINNENQVTVSFTSPMSGFAHLILFRA